MRIILYLCTILICGMFASIQACNYKYTIIPKDYAGQIEMQPVFFNDDTLIGKLKLQICVAEQWLPEQCILFKRERVSNSGILGAYGNIRLLEDKLCCDYGLNENSIIIVKIVP